MNKCTTDGKPPIDPNAPGAPGPIDPQTGQHTQYWVLCEEERAKGFVRPYRSTYIHKGGQPQYPLRDLTPEEHERYEKFDYVAYEAYPKDREPLLGRFWTKADLDGGCGATTSMRQAIAETYARQPTFYGSTFCCHCGKHYPVAEFVWEDGSVLGT